MPRQPDTAITRAAIKDAAHFIIGEQGVGKLSVSAVARRLGMSHGNIYRHFPSKEALLAEIASYWMADMREACDAAVGSASGLQLKLVALVLAIRTQLQLRQNDPDAFQVFEFVLKHKPETAAFHHHHRLSLVVDALVDHGCDRSVATEEVAKRVLDALRCFTDPYAVASAKEPIAEERVAGVVDLIVSGVDRQRSASIG